MKRGENRLTFYASTQAPHTIRGDLARALGQPETAIRVIAPDVGGGFGMKGGIYPEDVLVAWARLAVAEDCPLARHPFGITFDRLSWSRSER